MSDLNASDLDRIEAAIRQFDADGGGNTVIADKIQMQDYVSRADTLALVAALRAAWAERGRVVSTQRLRDVTLTTYERVNASGEARGEGG